MPTTMTDDGVALWFEVTGTGEGLPLVLCHGGPGLWDNLGPLATLLDAERPVIRWDQRGGGRSGGGAGPFTVARFVADLETIRTNLGVDRWIVGGHSWGATLALQYALAHPHRTAGLLYVSGTGLGRSWHPAYKLALDERLGPEERRRRDELEAIEHRSHAEEVEWRALRWAPDHADRERAIELATIDADVPWAINLECNRTLNAEAKTWDIDELTARCEALDVPALLVHGAHDPRPPFALDELSAALPDASTHVIDGAGHAPWLERPGAVAALTRRWLRELD